MLGAKYYYANKWIKNKWLLLLTKNMASKGWLVYDEEAKATSVVSIKQQDKEAFTDLKSLLDFTIYIFLHLFLHHGCVFCLN